MIKQSVNVDEQINMQQPPNEDDGGGVIVIFHGNALMALFWSLVSPSFIVQMDVIMRCLSNIND
jgi:hypothetical protein